MFGNLPCQMGYSRPCQDFLDELNYFCDTWVTLTESMWTSAECKVMPTELTCGPLKKHREIGHLAVAFTDGYGSSSCSRHPFLIWVQSSRNSGRWWLHESSGMGLLFCWSVTWPEFGAHFLNFSQCSWSSGGHQGKPFWRTANVLVAWLTIGGKDHTQPCTLNIVSLEMRFCPLQWNFDSVKFF